MNKKYYNFRYLNDIHPVSGFDWQIINQHLELDKHNFLFRLSKSNSLSLFNNKKCNLKGEVK